MISRAHLLRNYENKWGETPGDKLVIFRDITLAGSAGSIDLNGVVKPGAFIEWYPVSQQVLDSDGLLDIANGGTPQATDKITVAIIIDPNDLAG
jgi:hypothetical protein